MYHIKMDLNVIGSIRVRLVIIGGSSLGLGICGRVNRGLGICHSGAGSCRSAATIADCAP